MGMAPASAANVVIMIGRKRTRQASTMACSALKVLPCSRSFAMAKSIIMMAFFFTMPMSRMTPT